MRFGLVFSAMGAVACSESGVKKFNASPEAYITSHATGDEVDEGTTETIRGQVADADNSLYNASTYLGKKKVINLGVGFDVEPGYVDSEGNDMTHMSFAFDGIIDIPMDDNGLVVNFAALQYGEGSAVGKGMGGWLDAGYRIGNIEPLVGYDTYMYDDDFFGEEKADYKRILGGVNWWMKGHMSNLKAQVSLLDITNADGDQEWKPSVVIQSQAAF